MKRNQKPTAAQFGKVRARLAQLGLKPEQVDGAVGKTVGNRTGGGIVEQMIAALRALPKGRG